METHAHRQLKRLAVWFLRSRGIAAAAREVRCPISSYRLDAAGWGERQAESGRKTPHTIIIECKQDRSDFLRDNHHTELLLQHRRALTSICRAIESERIPREEPHLRKSGSSLFPELDEWDYASSRLPCYRRTLKRLERLDERLHGQTKFHRLAHFRMADQFYLLAPRGMVRQCEVPPGWGLLECPLNWLDAEASRDRLEQRPLPRVVIEAPVLKARDIHRQRLLRNIAVAASFAALR